MHRHTEASFVMSIGDLIRCHLPTSHVWYPAFCSSTGYCGDESVMLPFRPRTPFLWLNWPVRIAARLGEQIELQHTKLSNLTPSLARRSIAGVSITASNTTYLAKTRTRRILTPSAKAVDVMSARTCGGYNYPIAFIPLGNFLGCATSRPCLSRDFLT